MISVPLATTARGPSCGATPVCLRSPAELGLSALRVSLPVLPSPAPTPSLCLPAEAFRGALHTGMATIGHLSSPTRLTQVRPVPPGSLPKAKVPCSAPSPSGAVAEVPCRAGSYCGPQTGVPPLCPGGYACPAGSPTYVGPGQL